MEPNMFMRIGKWNAEGEFSVLVDLEIEGALPSAAPNSIQLVDGLLSNPTFFHVVILAHSAAAAQRITQQEDLKAGMY